MSSSSPPKDPTPASPDSEFMETTSDDDDDDQEMSSHPQLDPTLVYSPQPISSYNPNLTDMSNINLNAHPETAALIQSGRMSMSEIMEQRHGLDPYNLPDVSNIYSEIDPEIASLLYSESSDMSEITRQRQALDYYNRMKHFLPQDPVGISRTEPQVQEESARDSAARDDGYKFLFIASKNEAEDNLHTLKLLVRLRREGRISPPEHVNRVRFLERLGQLKAKYDIFVKKYPNSNKPLNRDAFSSESGYLSYIMSRFIWGDYVIPSDGSSTSTNVDSSYDPNDYEDLFDPNAPFYHPDMESYPYDPGYDPNKDKGPHSSNDSCQNPSREVDPDDQVLDRVKACFGSEFKPTAVPVTRVSAAGKKLIFKAPRPQVVKVKSGRDTELEADTAGLEEVLEDIEAADFARAVEISLGKVPEDLKGKRSEGQPAPKFDTLPLKKRKINALPEEIDTKQSKRRKVLDLNSPAKHDEIQREEEEEEEEERLLLPNSNNENDDDYDTLDLLFWYTLETETYILQQGAFVQNFETGVTEYINKRLPSGFKITTDQCKKKVMELREKFLKFIELNGGEDLSEADFSVGAEYDRFQMFRTVWGDSAGTGGSDSGANTNSCQRQNVDQGSNVEQGVNVGIAVQGAVGNMRGLDMNANRGNVADPIPAPMTHMSAAGKASQAVNVKSGADREFEDDMARAMAISLSEVRDNTLVQGAIGVLKDLDPKVDSGNMSGPGTD